MPVMTSVTMENFRCFRERQTVRLAPLTLLVGENSTGKTSFLALLRALSELTYLGRVPDFKAEPYDLGSFDEIAHYRGARGGRAGQFSAGVQVAVEQDLFPRLPDDSNIVAVDVDVQFGKETNGTAPSPFFQRVSSGTACIEERIAEDGSVYRLQVATERGQWCLETSTGSSFPAEIGVSLDYLFIQRYGIAMTEDGEKRPHLYSMDDGPVFTKADETDLLALSNVGLQSSRFSLTLEREEGLFAGAPVRSNPLRTYDPGKWRRSPTGEHIPMKIAELEGQQAKRWKAFKDKLERFGRASGLFDEIEVRNLGTAGRDPFQLQVRKGGKGRKGPFRNMIDVGYGVSQALPILTELLEPSGETNLYLLQQPEVHLHPSAQAALGSLFCELASDERQLVVETHSDHLMNRIRMEVRDGEIGLKPEDVLLLYFERDGLDVRIHEIRFDAQGNVCGAPESYREFFRLESRRSLGL